MEMSFLESRTLLASLSEFPRTSRTDVSSEAYQSSQHTELPTGAVRMVTTEEIDIPWHEQTKRNY